MKRKRKIKTVSIQRLLTTRLLLIIIIAVAAYQTVFIFSQSIWRIQKYSFDILTNQSAKKAEELSSYLKSVINDADRLTLKTEDFINSLLMSSSMKFPDISGRDEFIDMIYRSTASKLTDAFANNIFVTGALVYLDAVYAGMDKGSEMSCLYLKDSKPKYHSASLDDITLYRGSKNLKNELPSSVIYSPDWLPSQTRKEDGFESFFAKVEESAQNADKSLPRINSGYLSGVLPQGGDGVILYGEPLLDLEGNYMGICGFEISVPMIQELISGVSMPFSTGFYTISFSNLEHGEKAFENGEKTFGNNSVFSSDYAKSLILGGTDEIKLSKYRVFGNHILYTVPIYGRNENFFAVPVPLNIYGEKSYFKDICFCLYGIVSEDEILEVSRETATINYFLMAVTFILLAAGLFYLGLSISGTVKKLAADIKRSDTSGELKITRTYIKELDTLAQTFVNMNANIVRSAEKTSAIIDLVGMPVGIFELDLDKDRAMTTKSFWKMMKAPGDAEGFEMYMPVAQWERRYYMFRTSARLSDECIEEKKNEVCYEFTWEEKWYRVRIMVEGNVIYGVVSDITNEIAEKNRLEFERDYDPLTKLLNRASYKREILKKISAEPDKCGVIMFCDLDNLKFINDTYGHGAGDTYIQSSAEAFREFGQHDGVVARISGDEFVIYLHGETRERLIDTIGDVIQGVRQKSANIAEAPGETIKVSIGLSFYPSDSDDIEELIKYADFAMYEIKHSSRGGIRAFSRESFERNVNVSRNQDYIDMFIKQRRLKFAFQPVMNTRNCELFGYEVLLRPQIREIQSPAMLYQMAKSQSRLFEVETLVTEMLFDWIAENEGRLAGIRLFINSAASSLFIGEHWENFKDKYGRLIKYTVFELPPADTSAAGNTVAAGGKSENAAELGIKSAQLRELGSLISYRKTFAQGEPELEGIISPDIIKIDKSIAGDIDKDRNKQKQLAKVVSHTKKNNLMSIAIGVETAGELEFIVTEGVNFIQGFLVGMPAFELYEPSDDVKLEISEIIRRRKS